MTDQNLGVGPERRFLHDPQIRMEGDAAPVIVGYAAVFDSLSEDLGGFRERIRPGAFSATLDADVRALWNHDPNHVLGRTRSGTLELREDARGLAIRISPPESAAAMLESMRRGDVDQMSFAFRTITDEWALQDGAVVRTLLDVRLLDVSVVTYPAYPATEAALRSLEQFRAADDAVPNFTLARARLRLASA